MNYFGQALLEILENNWKSIFETGKERFCSHFLKFLTEENQPCKIMFFNFKMHTSREPVILEQQMSSFGKKNHSLIGTFIHG